MAIQARGAPIHWIEMWTQTQQYVSAPRIILLYILVIGNIAYLSLYELESQIWEHIHTLRE